MTKKILAAFLAVLMVVSMLPTSVGAHGSVPQPTGCPVAVEFGEDGHTIANCEAMNVEYEFIKVIEPDCGQDGYTQYKCECGVYFGSNFKPMPYDHIIDAELTVERVEPTCTEDGMATLFTCETCGDVFWDENEPDVDAKTGKIAKLGHNFDEAPGENLGLTNDCTQGIRYCANGCGETKIVESPHADHEWDYENPEAVVEAPSCNAPGKLIFSCKHEACGVKKIAEIQTQPDLHNATLKKIPAKEATCEQQGNPEYYVCETCDKKYWDKNGQVLITEDELEDLVIDYAHNYELLYETTQTCTTFGYQTWFCTLCGDRYNTEVLFPTGHSARPTDESKFTYVEPTCTQDGGWTWVCEHEGCLEVTVTEKDPAKGHTTKNPEVKEISVPANCQTGAYKFLVCNDPDCELDSVSTFTKGSVVYDVTLSIDAKGRIIDGGDDVKVISLTPTANSNPNANVHILTISYDEDKAPTCTTGAVATESCLECGLYNMTGVIVPMLGHDFSDVENDDLDCEDGYKACDRDDCDYQEANDGEHDFSVEGETYKAWCNKYGYTEFFCSAEGCEAMVEKNKVEYVTPNYYENSNAAKEYHLGLQRDTLTTVVPTGCETRGIDKVYCADCDTWMYWYTYTRGHSKPEAEDIIGNGCTEDQYYICENAHCENVDNKVILKKAPANKKHQTLVVVPGVDATCEADGVAAHAYCPACNTKFTDKTGATEFTGETVLPKLGHDMQVVVIVSMSCELDGFTYSECANGCGTKNIATEFVPMTGHSKVPTAEKDGLVVVAPDCEESGYSYYVCKNACGEELMIEGSEKDPTGHKNAKGEIFFNSCVDTTEDRFCVNKDCEYSKANNNPVPAERHSNLQSNYYPGTCTEFGYWIIHCDNGCEEANRVIVDQEPMGHLVPVFDYIRLDATEALDAHIAADFFEMFGGFEALVELCEENDVECPILAYTPATYEVAGSITYICPDCEQEVTNAVAYDSVDFTLEVDNAVVPGANTYPIYNDEDEVVDSYFRPVDSNIIAVDVYINAFNKDIWGFNFDVDYEVASMNYLGFVAHATDLFGVIDAHNNVEEYEYVEDEEVIEKYAYGYVTVFAQTENMADKSAANVSITGSYKLMTLYFQLEAACDFVENGNEVSYVDNGYVQISNYYTTITDADGNDDFYSYDDEFYFGIEGMLNVSGDAYGSVNAIDAKYAYEIVMGKSESEYDAAADVDNDGDVDAKDLRAMYDYIIGRIDDADVYAMNNWTAPEGFVAAQ